MKFRLDPAGYQRLIDDIDDALVFALEVALTLTPNPSADPNP